jgi:hypothetical protein
VEHRYPASGVGGVTGMDTSSHRPGPGQLTKLIERNLLIGGEPGSGKSGLLNGIVAPAALSGLDGDPVGGDDGQEG